MPKGTAGHKAKLMLTGGELEATGEAMSDTGDGVTYQINNAAKEIWYWGEDVTVYEDGVPTSQNVTIRYLSGRVVFDMAPTEPVTVDVHYLPKYTFALAREVDFSVSRADLETQVFGNENVQRITGLKDLSGSVESLQFFQTVLDTGEKTLSDILEDGDHVVLSYDPDGEGSEIQRAVIQFTEQSLSQPIDGLVVGSADFVSAAPKSVAGQQVVRERMS